MYEDALSYDRAIACLTSAFAFGINPSLDGIRELTEALGRPQDAFRSVQVTGTNGKTSVVRLTSAMIAAHGYSTGTYTSPHLISYTERIEIDGAALTESEFAAALSTVLEASGRLDREFTEFELLTASALVAFRDAGVEWAVLEVGMGGRWDATSVVSPAVAVITGVGLDHTDRLGTTREEIAADKACIIKPGCAAVLGPGCTGVEHIFEERAKAVGAPLFRVAPEGADMTYTIAGRPHSPGGVLVLDMVGLRELPRLRLHAPSYQAPNVAVAALACGTALWAPLNGPAIRDMLVEFTFPGRFEVLRVAPPLVIDGAHNPEAAGVLAHAIREAFRTECPTIVLAILSDKDAGGIVSALAPVATAFVVTENGSPRCIPAAELADVVERVTGVRPAVRPQLAEALAFASEAPSGVVVTGSLYTAGAVRKVFGG